MMAIVMGHSMSQLMRYKSVRLRIETVTESQMILMHSLMILMNGRTQMVMKLETMQTLMMMATVTTTRLRLPKVQIR